MAHGWDSYFPNLPPLSSDPRTLTRTSESEGSLSHHIENFIGHHDFSNTAASPEVSATNSNFDTNYYSNPSTGNSSSDCVYQKYYRETPWQSDGEQTVKDYLPRCGNSDISDFARDGLTSSGPFPSSLATDLQGLKQDCRMLATSFLEGYSDVSSCSDADVVETRPSCKYMTSNPVPKPKTDVTTKHSSSEWLFTHTGNMTFQTETNVISPSSSNVKARDNVVECAKVEMKSPRKTVKSCIGHNQSSTTFNMVPTTEIETSNASNDSYQDLEQSEDVKRDLTHGKYSDISISGLTGDGLEEHPDDNKGQTTVTVPMTFDNEQFRLDGKVLRKEINESFKQEYEVFDHSNSTDLRGDYQDKSEVLKVGNETLDEQKTPKPNTGGQDENMEKDCQEKEIQSNTHSTSDPLDIKGSDSKDAICELRECANTLECYSQDVGSYSQLSEYQSLEIVAQNNTYSSATVINDGHFSNANDKNEKSVASNSESCLQPNSPGTHVNPHLEKELTSAAERSNTDCNDSGVTFDSLSIDTNGKNQQVANNLESCKDTNPCQENECGGPTVKTKSSSTDPDCSCPAVTSESLSIVTSDNKKESVVSHLDSCLQLDRLSTGTNPCQEKEWTSPPEKTNTNASSSTGPECSLSNALESCLQPNTLSKDMHSCLEKENTDTTSSLYQQQAPHESPVALSGYVVDNARESFEELDTSKEQSELGVLYGEPLSREDSSCNSDEANLDTSQCEETSLAGPDSDSMNHSKSQARPLKSSIQMKKRLQPVVIMETAESANAMSNSYHCASCQHTTLSVEHLIEHHHCCHSVHNFHFCKTCNLYLMSTEQAEEHVCGVAKERPQLSWDPSLQKKRKHHGRHRCVRCGLIFSKLVQYVKHMRSHTGKTPYKCNACGLYFSQNCSLHRHKRIPGRCKHSKLTSPETNADDGISENKTSPKKDLLQKRQHANLPECYVKLVDISKTNLCSFCGKSFLTAKKAKKHIYNIHKGKSSTFSSSQYATKISGEKTEKVENEPSKYKCPLCPRLFKYSYNRARHLRDCVRDAIYGGKNKVGNKYQCPLCNATFTLPSNRFRHIKTSCLKECLNRLAKEKAKLRKNVGQKKTAEIDQENQAKEVELRKQSKENEQKIQESPSLTAPKTIPLYKCNLCPAVFCHASGKYRHMKKHELFKLTGKMFKYRNSVFSTMSKLTTSSSAMTEESKDNLKSTEAKSNLSLSCHFCGKCFSTSQSLKKHERNHRGERPYRCLDCGKGFKKRAHLIGHKIVHQRRIQCTVCRKVLLNIGELIQHRNSHQKRGKLQCPDCPLQFQYPAHLLRHLDGHKKTENKTLHSEEGPPLKQQHSLESVKETEPKQLQCSLCKEVFNNAQLLRRHCLTHISSSCQCPFCKHNFTTRRYLLRHMIKHTGDKPFSCTYCGKQFYRDLYLKLHHEKCLPRQVRHLVTVESDTKTKRPYHCTYCSRAFSKKDRLKSHHRGHKSNTLLLCSRCGQYYGFRKLNQHQQNCVGALEPNAVSSSSKSDFSKRTSQKTQNVHKMPSQSNATKMLHFKCPHCPQRFRFRSVLLRHIVSHTGVQPYACMHCGHRYSSQTMCLQHEAFCNGVYKEGQSKVKNDAATELSSMPNLREAAQKPQAEGEVEYKCKFCTKTFMKSRSLRRHILTHNEAKPYRCKSCDCCFTRYDYLKVHQTRCKGKRSRLEVCIPKISLDDVGKGWQNKFGSEPVDQQETFECNVCSRNFSTQSKLSRHVTMFHVAKLFKCSRCGSSFSHEKSLKKHRKINRCRKVSTESNSSLPQETNPPSENVKTLPHGVRDRVLQRAQPRFNKKYKYVCSYCPRAFGSHSQLGVHIRLHTGEKPYACDYCGERFIRKDYVQRHFVKCTKKQEQKKVLCDRCGGFFSKVKLENHKKSCTLKPNSAKSTVCQQTTSQSPPKGFSCAYCSSRFLLFSQLQEHFLNAHKLETMVPPVSTAPLQYHLSNIPSIKEEPLDERCDERLSDGANVICKLDTALDSEVSKPFVCPECNVSFASKAGLIGHLRVHAMDHPFKCKTCKKGFWNKSLLRNHNRKCRFGHFSAGSTPQQLEVPLKAEIDFALTDSVLVFSEGSKTTGTGVLQTNFSCKDDSMDESSQSSDGNQVQSNSSREKYQCSECDMSFTDGLMLISHLEDHGRREQEKKRNTCSKCGRVCSSQGNLEKHMKLHGINKKYSCPDCSKMVYTVTDLEIHRTCHDPNRPYSCKLCNHRFWTRQSLCNHYSEEHPNDVFTCRFCNKTYSVKKSLARHYRKWHQKEQKDLESTVQEKGSTEQQSSSQVSTAGESDEDENNRSNDSDSDSAPYFPCHVCGKTFPTSESLEDHQRCHLGEKPHECAECGKCFFQASQLQQHQRMHKSEFQCQTCGRGFVSLFALRKHKHTHGKSRPYRCSKCHLSFTGLSQLAEHMSTHREENFPCDICNHVFPSKSSRAEHRKSHSVSRDRVPTLISTGEQSASLFESSSLFTKELKYRCGVCSERFKDPEELSEHGCMAAKERPYSCSDCHKYFLHSSHLKKHRTTHQLSSSTSEYPCNQCNSSFSSPHHFLSHLKSHNSATAAEVKGNTEVKDEGSSHGFICPVCHQCFLSAVELMHHFPIHPDNALKCKICKMIFSSASKLEEHERCHLTSGTELECAKCGQSFLGSEAFLQHHCSRQQHAIMETGYSKPSIKTPSPTCYQAAGEEEEIDVIGEDLYNCPVCSMQFSSKSGLLEHQNKRHPHGKPFKCELCGKTFAVRRYLREHERRHRQKLAAENTANLAENKFNKCTQCLSAFNTAQELSLHMRMHAEQEVGEYRCDMCYKSFSKWSLLKQHQESHVGQVVYECTECDKAFAFPHLLEEHQLTHAGSSH
ncbi:zinc finger protein 1035 [Scomber scombrus]|uniref:Zinc finger protein 1035 n=1 Tax=Scomber scombrus TaxID=13677 RepID=A0AAV1NLQ6_SCOSC|nr:uncharacterized protein LOC133983774 [Scomber scombrus]